MKLTKKKREKRRFLVSKETKTLSGEEGKKKAGFTKTKQRKLLSEKKTKKRNSMFFSLCKKKKGQYKQSWGGKKDCQVDKKK